MENKGVRDSNPTTLDDAKKIVLYINYDDYKKLWFVNMRGVICWKLNTRGAKLWKGPHPKAYSSISINLFETLQDHYKLPAICGCYCRSVCQQHSLLISTIILQNIHVNYLHLLKCGNALLWLIWISFTLKFLNALQGHERAFLFQRTRLRAQIAVHIL